MPLKLSFAIQFSRSVPIQSGNRTSAKLIRRVKATLRRIRFRGSVYQPAVADQSSEITDTDSSWLGPPPDYDEQGIHRTCLGHAETDCSSDADLRAFESEAAIHSATVDGPVDMPAVTC
jgi:hypothetical protein